MMEREQGGEISQYVQNIGNSHQEPPASSLNEQNLNTGNLGKVTG